MGKREWFSLHRALNFTFSLTLKKKPFIRYYSYPSGYKDYCKQGKKKSPDRPAICPYCNAGNICLNGHGWYERLELVSGFSRLYGDFYIYRYICKNTDKTISMHPDFSHAWKQYVFDFVIFCLCERFLFGKTQEAVSFQMDVPLRTLRRWEYGLCDNELIKRLCFFPPGSDPHAIQSKRDLIKRLLQPDSDEDEVSYAATIMVRLEHEFQCKLY